MTIACDVCQERAVLSEPVVVALAEVITFAEVHSEHPSWAIRLVAGGGHRG